MSNSISVVIPVYNASKTIVRALDGVFSQSLLPQEVILINDGSTDNSVEVIKNSKYQDRVLVKTIPNGGPSNARNTGISMATGDWIAFLDADDEWINTDKLERQLHVVRQHQNAVLVDTFAKIYWNRNFVEEAKVFKTGNESNRFLFSNAVNATSSVLARKSAINEVGGFDINIRFGEDRLLWAQLARLGGVYTLDDYTVFKENHEENLTSKVAENFNYRVMLIERLTQGLELNPKEMQNIWLKNSEDFLRRCVKLRDGVLYRRFAKTSFNKAGVRFIFSPYSLLYLFSYFFSLSARR